MNKTLVGLEQHESKLSFRPVKTRNPEAIYTGLVFHLRLN